VALNLVLNWIFTFRLHWGHLGLAFSTGCVASCNFLILYALMYRQLGGLETRRMLVLLVKAGIAGSALAAVCYASLHWFLAGWAIQSFVRNAGALLGTMIAGGAVFLGCGVALRIEELDDVISALKRRLALK
jgi:peptidoglycan biosynthesis protein MviN/MurJ (putative lipid II flippase)